MVGHRLPGWVRLSEFWLVIGLASLLRIPPLTHSPFSSDDALLFLEAIRAVHYHLLPATGIFNSLLALNMPFYTWLLLPFATYPLGMAIGTGVANILTVGGVYIFGARYFGRVTGLIAGLLYATAMYPTWMSLFVWQQTLVAPFLLAAFFTLYLGIVDGKRHWLPFHACILAALIQIYPLTVTLVPLTCLGILLERRSVAWLDIPLAVLGPALLFFPTYLFESASGGYDIQVYLEYVGAPARVDSEIVTMLHQAIGALPADYFGAGTLYSTVAPSFAWLGTLLLLLSLGSGIWLTATILVPRLIPRPYRGISTTWRARLLLAVWPVIFLAATIRHASPVYIHYAFIILPILYLIIGVALAELPAWLARGSGILLSAVQVFATGAFIMVLASGEATAASWGGIPTRSFSQAVAIATSEAATFHSSQVYLVADATDPYMGLYWADDQNQLDHGSQANWTSYTTSGCALTPPHASGSGIVLLMSSPGPALRELLGRQNTHLLQRIPMARGADYPLYQIAANTDVPTSSHISLNGELQFDGAQLESAQGDLPARIVTSWTALDSTSPPGSFVSQYSFKFLLDSPQAPGLRKYWTVLTCAPQSWVAGEGIVLVFPLPPQYAAVNRSISSMQLRISVTRANHYWYQPQVGSLALETAKELNTYPVVLPLGEAQGPGLQHPTRSQSAPATIVVELR
jgi:4-amino-4-deoxy-L-arabinose transferase-like glycosyltransferase